MEKYYLASWLKEFYMNSRFLSIIFLFTTMSFYLIASDEESRYKIKLDDGDYYIDARSQLAEKIYENDFDGLQNLFEEMLESKLDKFTIHTKITALAFAIQTKNIRAVRFFIENGVSVYSQKIFFINKNPGFYSTSYPYDLRDDRYGGFIKYNPMKHAEKLDYQEIINVLNNQKIINSLNEFIVYKNFVQ